MKSRTLTCITAMAFVAVALVATAAHAQTYTVLYNFGKNSGDPQNPTWSGIIAQGRDGNLYSTTPQGQKTGCTNGGGQVFRITPTGTLTVINCSTGSAFSSSGLTLGTDGNFYGTAPFNGPSGSGGQDGTVFKITPGGTLSALHNFTGSDGKFPVAPPIQGIDGNFYGSVTQGGSANFGTVYKITPSLTFTVLHNFIDSTDGAFPQAPLVQGTDGNFYGTAEAGDSNSGGTAFKVTPLKQFFPLFDFAQSSTLGSNPFAPLTQGSDGNFYGTTAHGGAHNQGEVFKITPSGTLSVLHSFAGSGDGTQPIGGLVQATDGNLYGTTSMATGTSGCGTIFRISPGGTNFATLFTFPSDGSKGCNPQVTLVQHTNGKLYGDTHAGGTGGVTLPSGVFFSLNESLPPFVRLLPYSGKVGNTIEFLGQGFTSTSTVSFNGTAVKPTSLTGTFLMATVPSGATTGFVTVTTSSGTLKSNKIFRVTPQITSFLPTSGAVGTSVTITGVSLKQTTKVTFGGMAATAVAVNSDSQVTATVPSGALTGKIAITSLGGTAVSSGTFTVSSCPDCSVCINHVKYCYLHLCGFPCFLGGCCCIRIKVTC